ncbi:Transmembrane protein 161A/B family-containing protein [Strongyloides ratti]|uniref:Transmembrane protein 161A/B family-containing protein n=1 Tax=Strongyloides ratti TaxID=34506 RepID=A0A090LBT4_STRRB|nr:Transmembrane protein 161A/B family-containing protein [Strongyloides ratti]CEF67216.1 Transmembrane protein 161A/B family-containing protein [Strongyloides ratti]
MDEGIRCAFEIKGRPTNLGKLQQLSTAVYFTLDISVIVKNTMALLGFHVIVSLILLFLFNRFKSKFSFINFFISKNLYRYLPPTLEELRKINEKTFGKSYRGKNKKQKNQTVENDFKVPKNIEYSLHAFPVIDRHICQLNYYPTLYWLIDFSIFAIFVFTISETFLFFFPSNQDINISMLWLVLSFVFALQSLLTLTYSFFFDETFTSERNLILSSLAIYFVGCMTITMFGNKFLDINLDQAYNTLTDIINNFIESQEIEGISKLEKRSPLLVYLLFSVIFSLIGSALVFPSLRYATMYNGALKSVSKIEKLLLHSVFLLPVFILTLFTTPVKNVFVNGEGKFNVTEHQYELIRMSFIFIWVILRLVVRIPHLQSFLNLGYENAIALKKEHGNISASLLIRSIQQYFVYFCVACIQYIAPIIMTICLLLIYKNLGNICIFSEKCTSPIESKVPGRLGHLLEPSVQAIIWRYFLFMTLFTNTAFSIFGMINKVYFDTA